MSKTDDLVTRIAEDVENFPEVMIKSDGYRGGFTFTVMDYNNDEQLLTFNLPSYEFKDLLVRLVEASSPVA